MTKKLILAICLLQGLSILAMDEVSQYMNLRTMAACSDEENKQLHPVFTSVGTFTLDKLEHDYELLKRNMGIDLTFIIDLATNNTVLHELVLQNGSTENANFLIEEAGILSGLLVGLFKNKGNKSSLQLAQEQDPVNNSLVELLETHSEEMRTVAQYGTYALKATFYATVVGILFGGYKLVKYLQQDTTD